MQHFTILDDSTIKIIFDQYALGNALEYKLLSGGSENTNYWVRTAKGEYALTICEQKTETEATNLAQLLVHLNANGFATSQMIQSEKKSWIGDFEGKAVLLKKFIKGKVIADFSDAQMEILGQHLANLHSIETPDFVPQNLSYGMEHFPTAKEHAPDSTFSKWLLETATYIESFLKGDFPKALVHSDLFFNNIITDVDAGKLTIMDFEEAAHYYRVYDIGMTIVGTCVFDGKLNLEKMQCLLKGYQSKSPLGSNEKEALQAFTVYAATATAFWRFMNFNFVRPDEANKNKHKIMQDLAEHIKGISTEDFLSS